MVATRSAERLLDPFDVGVQGGHVDREGRQSIRDVVEDVSDLLVHPKRIPEHGHQLFVLTSGHGESSSERTSALTDLTVSPTSRERAERPPLFEDRGEL